MKFVVLILALAAAYVAGAQLGFLAAPLHEAVSSAWPPAGIALAGLLLYGRRLWPGVAVGAFVANLMTGVAVPAAAAIAAGNTLETLAGVWVLQAVAFRPQLERLRDVLWLTATALTVTAVSATIGVSSLWLTGAQPPGSFGLLWMNWWTGDAIGILVLAPLLLTWASAPLGKVTAALIEPTALVIVLGTITGFMVGSAPVPFVYPVFPIAVLAAYRLGPRGAAAANATVAAVAAFFTVRGVGSFVLAAGTPSENLFLFQGFVALVSITTLCSAAVLAERRRAEAELRLSEAHLSEAQAVAQIGSWQWDTARNHVEWSDALYHIYGLDRETFPATIQGYLERVHPDDRERVESQVRQALANRSSFHLDERIVRADGAVRVLETRGKVVPAQGRHGLVMIGVCQDVTDARAAQATLAQSEAKFATMFRASPVAICVIALDTLDLVDANARFYEMLGNPPTGSVIGVSPKRLGMWAEPGELRDLIARLRLQGSVREIPVKYVVREGGERRALAALEVMEIGGKQCAVALFWRP